MKILLGKIMRLMTFMKLSFVKFYHPFFLFFLFVSTFLIVLYYTTIPSFSITQCQRTPKVLVNGGYLPSEGWEGKGCYCSDSTHRALWSGGYSSTSYQCPRIPGSGGTDIDDDDTTDDSGVPYSKDCDTWEQTQEVNSCNGKKRYICRDYITNSRNRIAPLMRNLAEETGWGSRNFCPTDEEANSCKSNLFFSFVFDNEWHCFDLINKCGGTEKLRWKRNWNTATNKYDPTSIFCEGDPQDKPDNDSSDKPNNNSSDNTKSGTSQECPRVKVIINSYPYKTGTVKLRCNIN